MTSVHSTHNTSTSSPKPAPGSFPLRFRPMVLDDVPAVDQLERRCFPTPWPASAYRRELRHNEQSHYWVVCPQPDLLRPEPEHAGRNINIPSLFGYGGYWLVIDEAHIVTIATHPDWRRRKLGAWLLINMLAEARNAGAIQATLEVRANNSAAKALYEGMGFIEVGYRKGYYPPTKFMGRREDAILMTLFGLDIANVWQALDERCSAITFTL